MGLDANQPLTVFLRSTRLPAPWDAPAAGSEGCIQVKGCKELPLTAEEVESVTVTEKGWNFGRKKQGRPKAALKQLQLLRRLGNV
jgi:hypothetical protein